MVWPDGNGGTGKPAHLDIVEQFITFTNGTTQRVMPGYEFDLNLGEKFRTKYRMVDSETGYACTGMELLRFYVAREYDPYVLAYEQIQTMSTGYTVSYTFDPQAWGALPGEMWRVKCQSVNDSTHPSEYAVCEHFVIFNMLGGVEPGETYIFKEIPTENVIVIQPTETQIFKYRLMDASTGQVVPAGRTIQFQYSLNNGLWTVWAERIQMTLGYVSEPLKMSDLGVCDGDVVRVKAVFAGDGSYGPSESEITSLNVSTEPAIHETHIGVLTTPPTDVRELEVFWVSCRLVDDWINNWVVNQPIRLVVYKTDGTAIYTKTVNTLMTSAPPGSALFSVDTRDFQVTPPITGAYYAKLFFDGTSGLAASYSDDMHFNISGTYGEFEVIFDELYPASETYYGPAVHLDYWGENVLQMQDLMQMKDQILSEIVQNGGTPLRMVVARRSLLDVFGIVINEQWKIQAEWVDPEVTDTGTTVAYVQVVITVIALAVIAVIAYFIVKEIMTGAYRFIWGDPFTPPAPPDAPCSEALAGTTLPFTCPGGTVVDPYWICVFDPDSGIGDWVKVGSCPEEEDQPEIIPALILIVGIGVAGAIAVVAIPEILESLRSRKERP